MAKPITRPGTKFLYFAFKDPITNKWVNQKAGDFVKGQEEQAQVYIDQFLQGLAATGDKASAGPITVRAFIEKWLASRSKKPSYQSDKTRLHKHVVPRIGDMHMIAVKPITIDDLIMALRNDGKLAPKTIRQVGGLLSQLFKRAYKEGVVLSNPVQWERGTLPKAVDKDASWRAQAIFTRQECATLIAHPAIPWDRRVLTALKFLAALRHSEAANMHWWQYDATTAPLGTLHLGKTKSGVPRAIPVHPVLAQVLADWRANGWREIYGRAPTSDDLIVPTRNMTAEHPGGTPRQPAEAQEAFIGDLGRLGMRVDAGTMGRKRRGHDLRRTFISLARGDGALDGPLRWVTHGPSASSMTELYSTFTFDQLCAEVAKLKIELPDPEVLQASCKAAPSVGKRWKKLVTPKGLEPLFSA